MGEVKRVLQVLGTTNLGGAESRIMDLYRHMNREKLQFDFLVHTITEGYFDREITSLGGRIYHLPAYRVINGHAYRKACKDFFQSHNDYLAVHGHITSTASIYLPIAKKQGIPLTIAHARSAGVDKGIKGLLTIFLRRNLFEKTDVALSCSKLAARAVFGKRHTEHGEVMVLPNAIDTEVFAYNLSVRKQIREELSWQDAYVIGHVGRFHYAKNHEYLIRIFKQITLQNEKARLLLVGDGPLRGSIEQLTQEEGVADKVRFIGNKTPVSPYYQAMDLFLFPSRFEGMPGTVVEAQASGLPCLISDTITQEVKGTDLVNFCSIEEEPIKWAKKAEELSKVERKNTTDLLKENGFDVAGQVKRYEQFYTTGDTVFLEEGI